MIEKEILREAYILELERGFFTISDIAEECRMSYGGARIAVDRLLKKGLVKKLEKKKHVGGGGKYKMKGSQAARFVLDAKAKKKFKVVLTTGCFDVIHPGHLATLEEAKKLGDILVVVVASDSTIRKTKKREPVFPEEDRKVIVESLKPVDVAIVGEKKKIDKFGVIKKIKPKVLVFGRDQRFDISKLEHELKHYKVSLSITRLGVWVEGEFVKNIKKRLKG